MSVSAFPTVYDQEYPGLTKREYAAIHIAAAIVSRVTIAHDESATFALRAVALADAVLREAGE